MEQVRVYRTVFKRDDITMFDVDTIISNPKEVFLKLGLGKDYKNRLSEILKITNKKERNQAKREFLPAAMFSDANILSIDIDGISENKDVISKIIAYMQSNPYCFACSTTASGNLVAMFKYECNEEDYPYLYYKLYLELTLALAINLDFLPEIERLRYICTGGLHHYNKDALPLTEILKVGDLPYISTTPAVAEEDKEVGSASKRRPKVYKRKSGIFYKSL